MDRSPLPPNQVQEFPDMEPFGSHDLPPGLPTTGGPQVYDEQAAEHGSRH